MKRVRRYVAHARRQQGSEGTKRIKQSVGLPAAGFVALSSAQLALLSASDSLTLSAAAPMIWLTLCFTGMLAVFMTWFQR
jgi:hypothetical protein